MSLNLFLLLASVFAVSGSPSGNNLPTPQPENPVLPSVNPNTNGSTYDVCEKMAEIYKSEQNFTQDRHIVTYLTEYGKENYVRVIQGTTFNPQVLPTERNGFIDTAIACYNGHHNFIIRPDDIWTAIISQFSLYVNAHSEKFRKRFVNFDKKQTLRVELGSGNLDSVSYSYFVQEIIKKIDGNIVDPEMRNWIMPNFTTTTEDDYISTGIIFMATMKNYFDYVGGIACGIPKITIEGTLTDWEEIEKRLIKLRSYELEEWVDKMLKPILAQFVNAKSGKFDKQFWNSMVKVEEVGCGTIEVSGWITAFNVFNGKGESRTFAAEGKEWPTMEIWDIISGVIQVDVLIDDNGIGHNTTMFAGHIGMEILPDGYTLKPKIGWAIALKLAKTGSPHVGDN